ncbi:alpha-2-macroglobulin family protein [Dechloromonas sp. XY25]|uniref:Alpha-2-macroglobulin family protein n=1 Tax=Dechloromonas hankyongensis TaxID=2908002 RepID=A0ABS9K043_9RHOO|nr:alpha-2-macroglobulin [Dechloromonas hankyongensis]MCG2576528.1 alpha-2-macroglobulin family protein [Dechloromonas hankyongensis]
MSFPSLRLNFRVVALLLVALAAIAAVLHFVSPLTGDGANPADSGPFQIADVANRDFEGSPALAISFTHPMSSRGGYDEQIQVFEMPARAGDGAKQRDEADEEEGYGDSSTPVANPQVSTKPEDVRTEGGKLVKGAWVVGDNPRLLYFPHIKPQTRYVLRIAAGLPSAGGQKLNEEGRYSVLTATVSPAYYFASRGMVLPAKQNGGLPVVTVNVPEVDIQFLRVKPDQLPRFLDKVISGPRKPPNRRQDDDGEYDYEEGYDWRATDLKGAVNNWSLDALHKLTDSVFVGRFLTEQKANKRNVTFIPVEDIKELREPGIYIAVMSQPNRFRYDYQVTYFYVSDLGLATRLFTKGADAYVSSLSSGKAVSGVEVSWLDENAKVVARAETDSTGRAAFVERPASARVVVARQGQQVSMITLKEPALDLSEYDVAGLPGRPVRLFAYSGRNLYRPGEKFALSVHARDADGRPVAPQPIQAILRRPDGKSQFTATWQPDPKLPGYYQSTIDLPVDAPTGFWTLELRADPADKQATTSYRFGVEEFLPERMKLDLSSQQASVAPDDTLNIAVKGAYLYGAPAAGNQLLGVAVFERQKNPLAQKLPGFEFGDANEDSQRERVELEQNVLDENGNLELGVDLSPAQGKRSPYTVRTTLSLLESGGRPVVRNFERVIWPAPVLVGVRPLFTGDYAREGSVAQFEVIRANADGKLHGGKGLPVRLFRENRDYYWRFDDQRGWHSGFTETDELVDTASVSVPDGGRGKLGLPVKYGRYRLEITDPETRQTSKYRFYAGWSARSDETQGVRPDRVALKFDKPAYRDGDTARLTITPPHAGEALVTVDGDKTLWVKRTSVSADGTTLDIPVDKEWKRHDLYVSVSVLRPGGSGEKVTPARALGLAHLPLDRADRKLAVSVEAPKKMLPETKLKVKVKAAGAAGQKAMVTLSAVDVGILNITRFTTPDPHGHFFGKQRYGADQYDVYGRLIEKMAGQKGKLKFGGDAAPKATKSLPKKVRLVDLFSGPVQMNEQGEAEVALDVPDFNGTLRLMAVVAAPDRFGSAEAETVVAAPLVAELMTPRFLTVGDNATIALDLHNLSGEAQKLKVRVINGDGLKIQNAEREIDLKDQQKQTLRFGVEAGNAFGLADVRVAVSSAAGLKLERSFGLQVQAATPQQQILKLLAVGPGESVDIKEVELGGFVRSTVQAHLLISDKAPIDVRGAIQGLLTYPYGCAEQTTSTAYPHVFVDEEGARLFGLKPYSREQRADMLDKVIARLGAMQAPNGGFSLWGNVSEYQYWLSAYVSNFLLDAREQGFSVPEAMQKNAMDFLLKNLQEGAAGLPSGKVTYRDNGWQDYRFAGSGRFGVLAYGGYVLARESKAPLSTLRQMFELREQAHSGLALVHLGLALKLMGDETRAQTALAEGVKKSRDTGYWWGDYGSPLRDAALSFALLERHKLKVEGKDNLVAVAAAELGKNRYTSTQEKLALFLLGRQFAGQREGDTAWTAELAGKERPENLSATGSVIRSLSAEALQGGWRVKNTHKEKLYLQLSLSGNPAKMPANRDDAIALSRDLFEADGKPMKPRVLRVGESVIVRINVNPRSWVNTGMVVDRIPAGLEIENLNLAQGEGIASTLIDNVNPAEAMRDPRIQHVEFRDDRFVVAARLQGKLALFYRARVVTPGKFVFPPIYAEDMYRPDVYGLATGEATLTVSDGKEGKAGVAKP